MPSCQYLRNTQDLCDLVNHIYYLASSVCCSTVVPITSILGRLALMPVEDTGTIPFSMHNEKTDLSGAICDSKKVAGDSNHGGISTVLLCSGPQASSCQ